MKLASRNARILETWTEPIVPTRPNEGFSFALLIFTGAFTHDSEKKFPRWAFGRYRTMRFTIDT